MKLRKDGTFSTSTKVFTRAPPHLSQFIVDPRKLAKQSQIESQHRADLDEEERIQRNIEKQIEAAMAIEREHHGDDDDEDAEEEGGDIQLDEREGKVRLFAPLIDRCLEKISLNLSKRSTLDRGIFFTADEENSSSRKKAKTLPFGDASEDPAPTPSPPSHPIASSNAPKSALQLLMEEEEQRKLLTLKKSNHSHAHQSSSASELPNPSHDIDDDSRYPHWLHRQIVVKIMNKRLGNGRYYKLKGVIEDITGEGYVGVIRVLPQTVSAGEERPTNERIKVDQEELETVIPQVHDFLPLPSSHSLSCR
jgi:DNA/RNA-binding protein KIN17